jgi:hypothetical protein
MAKAFVVSGQAYPTPLGKFHDARSFEQKVRIVVETISIYPSVDIDGRFLNAEMLQIFHCETR